MSHLDDRRDIQTCRDHHAHLEAVLKHFPQLNRANSRAIAEALDIFKTLLLRHLRFEDELLYPRLLASGDPLVVATAVRFQDEMGGLAARCSDFFVTWEHAEAIDTKFARFETEWKTLREALEHRIVAEDDGLYEIADARSL